MKKRKKAKASGAIYVADELWIDERFRFLSPGEKMLFFSIAAHRDRLKLLEARGFRDVEFRDLIRDHVRSTVPAGVAVLVASPGLVVDYCLNGRHAAAEARKRLKAEKARA